VWPLQQLELPFPLPLLDVDDGGHRKSKITRGVTTGEEDRPVLLLWGWCIAPALLCVFGEVSSPLPLAVGFVGGITITMVNE